MWRGPQAECHVGGRVAKLERDRHPGMAAQRRGQYDVRIEPHADPSDECRAPSLDRGRHDATAIERYDDTEHVAVACVDNGVRTASGVPRRGEPVSYTHLTL